MTEAYNNTTEKRQSSSCGDRSLALTFYEGYQYRQGHALNTAPGFADEDTSNNLWEMGAPSFLAWVYPGQPSTVPLYDLSNPTTTDRVYLISTNGSAPTLSGFTTGAILAYVYPTQICGSVPLYAASKASVGDHWYTTDLAQHNELMNKWGWADAGVTAYVLPPIDCACGSY